MKRILILTNDKNNAFQLRNAFEDLRVEFEIAIGKESAHEILSTRYMNLIIIDAATLEGGSSWVFTFLAHKGLQIPVVILGADEKIIAKMSGIHGQVYCVSLPIDQEKLHTVLHHAGMGQHV